ncbi:MAG: hypothetical protein ACYSWX_08445 [Planctomycetota bacterium]|jgi:hypothetical protein
MSPASDNQPTPPKKPKPRFEKPDEMSDEVVNFIAAIDDAKRKTMQQHLELEAILDIVHELGFRSAVAGRGKGEVRAVEQALADYRQEHDRLFPNWSEVWSVLRELGYERVGR